MSKIMTSEEVAKRILDGYSVMIGGFGNRGYPKEILKALLNRDVNDLSVIVNALNENTRPELDQVVKEKASHLTCTFMRYSKVAFQYFYDNKLTLLPQGTFAESIRLGGMGIPAYYNPVGVGTELAKDKEVRTFNNKEYLLEKTMTADVALMRVNKADKSGNCIISGAAKSFSPLMALASKEVYVEAEEVVEVGELNPELVTIPNILVSGIVQLQGGENNGK